MPRTLCWRRLALAATLGAAAAAGLTPAPARADALVASFVGDRLASPQGTKPLAARPAAVVGQGPAMNPSVGFVPSDRGTPGHRAPAQASHTREQALREQLTLSALILMVFDVPAMPSLETSDPVFVLSGPGDTSLTQSTPETVSSSSPSPPTAPEPTALLSGLLGFGLTGMYTMLRWRTRRRRRLLTRLGALSGYAAQLANQVVTLSADVR